MTSPLADSLEQLRHEFSVIGHDILLTRYLTLASLVILVFETTRKLAEDLTFIWPARYSVPKSLYILNRIIVLAGLLTGNYALGGFQDRIPEECRFIFTANSILATVSIGIADALVTYEVWTLWDKSRTAMWMMIGSFVATYAVAIGCMTTAIITHTRFITYDPSYKVCGPHPAPKIVAGVYASGLVFEVIMFASAFVNVLAKPRDSRTSLTKALLRDGTLYFVAVSALRLTNVLMVLLGRVTLYYSTAFFVWTMITLLVNRLVLNQYRGRLSFAHRLTMELSDTDLQQSIHRPCQDNLELAVVSPPRSTRHAVVF